MITSKGCTHRGLSKKTGAPSISFSVVSSSFTTTRSANAFDRVFLASCNFFRGIHPIMTKVYSEKAKFENAPSSSFISPSSFFSTTSSGYHCAARARSSPSIRLISSAECSFCSSIRAYISKNGFPRYSGDSRTSFTFAE